MSSRGAMLALFAILCASIMIAAPMTCLTDYEQNSDTAISSDFKTNDNAYVPDIVLDAFTLNNDTYSNTFLDDLVLGLGTFENGLRANSMTVANNDDCIDKEFWDGKLMYKITSDTTCKVINYKHNPGNLSVPDTATYEGRQYIVNEIGDHGLSTKSPFGSLPLTLELGPNIEVIGNKAVSGNFNVHDCCRTLTFRDIEHSKLREIGPYAFEDCYFLEITLPASIEHIGYRAFNDCMHLEKVTILPGGPGYEVGKLAFYGCLDLKEINLENARKIDSQAFLANNLKFVNLSSATYVEKNAFESCHFKEIIFGDDIDPNGIPDYYTCADTREFYDQDGNRLQSSELAGKTFHNADSYYKKYRQV